MLLYEQECLSLSYWWNIMMALVRWCKEVPQVVIKLTCFEYVVYVYGKNTVCQKCGMCAGVHICHCKETKVGH